ncbi:hypothetical protein Dimus_033558, partial [Dionaea muscipula]
SLFLSCFFLSLFFARFLHGCLQSSPRRWVPVRLSPAKSGSAVRVAKTRRFSRRVWEDWLRPYAVPYAFKDKSKIRSTRFLLRMVNKAKEEDGELRKRLGRRGSSRISPSIPSSFSDLGEGRASGLTTAVKIDSMGVSADDPCRCGDSDPRCAADWELGLPLCPIVEKLGLDGGQIQNMKLSVVEKRGLNEGEIQNMERSLAGDEFQTTDGDTRPMMEDGQASSVLPDLPSQVVSYPSPLLPLEIATMGLEELGEGFANYVQVSSLPRVPVAVHDGLSTELLRTQSQEEDLQLGVPLMAGTGRDSLRTEAGHVEPTIPLTPGASVGSGDRGGSGLSYASTSSPRPWVPVRLLPAKSGSAVRVAKMRRFSRRLGGLAPSIEVPYECNEKSKIRYHRFLLKMVNQAKSEDGELRERLGRRRSSRISPSIPSSFSYLEVGRASGLTTALGLPLSPIVEEVGLDGGEIQNMELSVVEKRGLNEGEIQNMERSLAGDEFQTTDGDTRPMMEDGQASSVLPDLPSQVVSYPSPLLPLEIATMGLEELGEGFANYVQVSSLPRVPVAMHDGLSTEVMGGHHAQLMRTQSQEEDLPLGVPLMAGTGRDSLGRSWSC